MSSFWQTFMFVLMILVAIGLFILWLYATVTRLLGPYLTGHFPDRYDTQLMQ
jgi:hypothetical protein